MKVAENEGCFSTTKHGQCVSASCPTVDLTGCGSLLGRQEELKHRKASLHDQKCVVEGEVQEFEQQQVLTALPGTPKVAGEDQKQPTVTMARSSLQMRHPWGSVLAR